MPDTIGSAFHETVEEGTHRLYRTWPALLATGTVGGIDVSFGVLATFLILHRTGNELVAAIGFGIGFIALTMANSELFTENFLVPISAVAAKKARVRDVARLWVGTAATNLVGGLAMVALIVLAFPEVADTSIHEGGVYIERGISVQALASAVLAGITITLMTWMQAGTRSMAAKLVAALLAAFVLSYGKLSHVIVASLEVFAGILSGATYGFGDWFWKFWLWGTGNALGGIGMVTVLRLLQVGAERLQREQERDVQLS